jgi:hypothetical protein
MRKLILFFSTILLVVILFFIIVNALKTEPKIVPTSTWTKAVCNEKNYCLDIQITCSKDRIIDIKPTGEGAYFPEGWIDPRPIEVIKKWC